MAICGREAVAMIDLHELAVDRVFRRVEHRSGGDGANFCADRGREIDAAMKPSGAEDGMDPISER